MCWQPRCTYRKHSSQAADMVSISTSPQRSSLQALPHKGLAGCQPSLVTRWKISGAALLAEVQSTLVGHCCHPHGHSCWWLDRMHQPLPSFWILLVPLARAGKVCRCFLLLVPAARQTKHLDQCVKPVQGWHLQSASTLLQKSLSATLSRTVQILSEYSSRQFDPQKSLNTAGMQRPSHSKNAGFSSKHDIDSVGVFTEARDLRQNCKVRLLRTCKFCTFTGVCTLSLTFQPMKWYRTFVLGSQINEFQPGSGMLWLTIK